MLRYLASWRPYRSLSSFPATFAATLRNLPPSFNPSFGAVLGIGTLFGFAPLLVVAIGWLLAGRSAKRSLFIATGIIGILSIAFFGVGFETLGYSFLSTGPANNPPDIGAAIASLVIGGVGELLLLVYFILNVVSLFSARKTFGVKYFRYAGIGMIVSVLVLIAGFVVLGIIFVSQVLGPTFLTSGNQAGYTGSSQEAMASFFKTVAPLVVVMIAPFIISNILAALAFFKARSQTAIAEPSEVKLGPI